MYPTPESVIWAGPSGNGSSQPHKASDRAAHLALEHPWPEWWVHISDTLMLAVHWEPSWGCWLVPLHVGCLVGFHTAWCLQVLRAG